METLAVNIFSRIDKKKVTVNSKYYPIVKFSVAALFWWCYKYDDVKSDLFTHGLWNI